MKNKGNPFQNARKRREIRLIFKASISDKVYLPGNISIFPRKVPNMFHICAAPRSQSNPIYHPTRPSYNSDKIVLWTDLKVSWPLRDGGASSGGPASCPDWVTWTPPAPTAPSRKTGWWRKWVRSAVISGFTNKFTNSFGLARFVERLCCRGSNWWEGLVFLLTCVGGGWGVCAIVVCWWKNEEIEMIF